MMIIIIIIILITVQASVQSISAMHYIILSNLIMELASIT